MSTDTRASLAGCALLILLVAGIYGQTAGHGFVNYDDKAYITGNPMVLRGLTADGVRWAFTSVDTGNWHPLTWFSHMLDVSLFGSGAGGPHLVSAGIHAANACILFLLLTGMTAAPGRALVVAALFAVHPLRVESVAWAAERKDLLATLLMLAALTVWLRRVGRPGRSGWPTLAAAAALYALALMAKPMPVTFPFLLLLLDWWPLGRGIGAPPPAAGGVGGRIPWTRLAGEKWPFLLLAAVSSIVTVHAQRAGGAVSSLSRLPLAERIGNALVSYGDYLVTAAWPANLAVFYPYPPQVPWGAAAVSAVILAAVTVAVLFLRRYPFLPVGWFWYLGTLVPVIGLVQVGLQAHADRYTYLPLTGIFIAVVWGTAEFLPPKAARCAAAAAIVALAAVATLQVRHWRDETALFGHAAMNTEGNWLAWVNYGGALSDAGRYPEAASALERGLAIKPSYAPGWVALGWMRRRLGEGEAADTAFSKAVQVRTGDTGELLRLGRILLQAGEPAHAIGAFRNLLALSPDSAQARIGLAAAHNGVANRLMRSGRPAEAIPHYREALRLVPTDEGTRANLERALRE